MILGVNSISFNTNKYSKNLSNIQKQKTFDNNETNKTSAFPYFSNFVSFKAERRSIPYVDYEEYRAMSKTKKEFLRRKCNNFALQVNSDEMFDPKDLRLPLLSDKDMDDFIKISSIYNKHKDKTIVCLGRSPKWFLNASLWMKDGIGTYKFIPFSQNWYRWDNNEGMRRINIAAPSEKEEEAYFKFLRHKNIDPKTIVKKHKEEGKKTVITDYIQSSKGITSFLDVMSRFAVKQNVSLKDFAEAIEIVGIGSLEYTGNFYHDDENFSVPRAKMPILLQEHDNLIKQEFHDMPMPVFEQMLLNRNSNECRSTFYPHKLWTAFNPDKYKTGMMSEEKMKALQLVYPANKADFTPAMQDFRNLLNFRILDYLSEIGLLKDKHKSKL